MEEADQETVADISSKTWNAMQYSLEKEGYREGAASGKESAVQASFDQGYSEGFKLAYAKGIILGLLTVLENEEKSDFFKIPEVKNELQIATNCVICNSNTSEIKYGTVKSVLKYAQDTADIEIDSLRDKYGQLLQSMKLEPNIICKKN